MLINNQLCHVWCGLGYVMSFLPPLLPSIPFSSVCLPVLCLSFCRLYVSVAWLMWKYRNVDLVWIRSLSLSCCKLVLMVHALRINVQVGHINCTHSHECRIHTVTLVAFFNLGAAACHAFAVSSRQRSLRWGKITHVVMIISRHRAQLQAANHAWSTTALGAHVIARWASLPVLVLQVTKVARKHVGARARCHYTRKKKREGWWRIICIVHQMKQIIFCMLAAENRILSWFANN